MIGSLDSIAYYENKQEELYVKDDKRVLIVGGTHYGKSRATEMMKIALIGQGYTQTNYTIEKTRDVFWIDELSSCYDMTPTNFLTYYQNMSRIEPSSLIMKLIGRI